MSLVLKAYLDHNCVKILHSNENPLDGSVMQMTTAHIVENEAKCS